MVTFIVPRVRLVNLPARVNNTGMSGRETPTRRKRRKSATEALSDLIRAERQARNHRRTRRAHLSEIAEDYVEIIADLIEAGGEARAVDIARRLGVTHVTVTKTISRLQRDGWVTSRPYRAIFLTESGKRLAGRVKRRHQLVVQFLKAIGVSDEIARADAEGIEHHVSNETLAAFESLVARAKK
jgi:DtxR family manganese transport transcriptional regulator